jgi:hypothetical protein
MEHVQLTPYSSLSWEADGYLVAQEISHLLWNQSTEPVEFSSSSPSSNFIKININILSMFRSQSDTFPSLLWLTLLATFHLTCVLHTLPNSSFLVW